MRQYISLILAIVIVGVVSVHRLEEDQENLGLGIFDETDRIVNGGIFIQADYNPISKLYSCTYDDEEGIDVFTMNERDFPRAERINGRCVRCTTCTSDGMRCELSTATLDCF